MKSIFRHLLILAVLVNMESFATEKGKLLIVVKDSVALYSAPETSATPSKHAMMGLQLQVLEVSPDERWYKVKIGEQKGYQLRHEEQYWVLNSDVFQEPVESKLSITLDVSAFHAGDLSKAKRISHKDYIFKQRSINLTVPYYVGCTYTNISPELTCSPPFSICAQIYEPKKYFLFAQTVSETDAANMMELENRYKTLFENGTVTPWYRIQSKHNMRQISEKVVCSKLVMRDPGCYAERYSGTEFKTLRTKVETINSSDYFAAIPVKTPFLFQSQLEGGVQTVYLLFILDVTFEDGSKETAVRRIVIWWPKCL